MEATICQLKPLPQFRQSTPKIGSFNPTIVSSVVKNQQIRVKDGILRGGLVPKLKCCEGNSVSALENEEESIGIKELNGKCEEAVGVVELLECLEREAIMGEDEGREPTDYNRRALIFDKSSKVFQALKQNTSSADL